MKYFILALLLSGCGPGPTYSYEVAEVIKVSQCVASGDFIEGHNIQCGVRLSNKMNVTVDYVAQEGDLISIETCTNCLTKPTRLRKVGNK